MSTFARANAGPSPNQPVDQHSGSPVAHSSPAPPVHSGPVEVERSPLSLFNQQVIECQRCHRLRDYCEEVATSKRRAYLDWVYWGKPVPSFGDTNARVLIVGLAPGAHGSNRTGRPFTGDGSGDFLYPVLHATGFASQAESVSRGDGMQLHDCWINAVVRCAPPDNKPKRVELANCAPYLDQEIALLPHLRAVVCLGRIAFESYLEHLVRTQQCARKPRFQFAHGAEYTVPGGPRIIASFHPSLQNTNTGKLTRSMLRNVFERARTLANVPANKGTLRG